MRIAGKTSRVALTMPFVDWSPARFGEERIRRRMHPIEVGGADLVLYIDKHVLELATIAKGTCDRHDDEEALDGEWCGV